MAAPTNHWKLGLFVIAGLAMAMAVVVLLAARSMQRDVVLYTSYFDESVQGLEVGSPIKFRGVTIGTVSKIEVAPDHRHVEIESALGVDELTRLGLDIEEEPGLFNVVNPPKLEMAEDLRLQLASSGLTGVKFLQLDFFDVVAYPPPELPFQVPDNYIPTAPSTMKGLEDGVVRMMKRLPEITDQIALITGEIEGIVSDVRARQLPERVAATLDEVNGLLATVHGKIDQVDTRGISRDARRTLEGVIGAVGRLDGILARVNQDDGLLTSVQRGTDAIGDLLHGADGLGGQMVDTLGSVQAAVRSFRKFTEALEQDPDMLLKGRSPERKR